MDKELAKEIRRAELKHYLSEEEMTLPDLEREELLLQRKWVDTGVISESDIIANRNMIQTAAKKSVAAQNRFNFGSWFGLVPRWAQLALVLAGVVLLVWLRRVSE